MEHYKFFISEAYISNGIICTLDGILKSLSLLEDICGLTNTIKPPIHYMWTDYTDIQTDYQEKIHLISFLLCRKYQYFHLPFYVNHHRLIPN